MSFHCVEGMGSLPVLASEVLRLGDIQEGFLEEEGMCLASRAEWAEGRACQKWPSQGRGEAGAGPGGSAALTLGTVWS